MKTNVSIKQIVLIYFGMLITLITMAQPKNISPEKESGRIYAIRSYNLKPGVRSEFHNVVVNEAVPMLHRWKFNVVDFGPSIHDENSYFIIRGYSSIADMEKQENSFYGSEEWKKGPREAVLGHILNYTTVVITEEDLYQSIVTPSAKTVVQESDRATLSALNAKFIRNYVTNDTASHNTIVHKDFVYISSSGKIIPRDTYMNNWAHDYDPKVYKSFEYNNEFIRIFGNMALVRANNTFSWMENGKLKHGKTVYTDTYVKENGRWWCVQAQITDVK
jgi:hypothetical protein